MGRDSSRAQRVSAERKHTLETFMASAARRDIPALVFTMAFPTLLTWLYLDRQIK
jgi:hypothetical protein